MQLNIFHNESLSTNSKIRKDKVEAIQRLFVTTKSYFLATDIVSEKSLKSFESDFLFLCEDLLNDRELDCLKRSSLSTQSKKSIYIGDYFDDPRKDYYEILIEYLKKGNINKKQLGAFYTPQDVVVTLIEAIIERHKLKISDLCEKKVLDPTMGGGDWLTSWFERSLSSCSKKSKILSQTEKEVIFSNTIHGVDIDPVAVICTRLIFWHYFDYKTSSRKILKNNLRLGNTLDIFTDKKKSVANFDVVIGNPPYVVQNLKHIPCYTNSCNNLFAALTEAASELLVSGGLICFVVPLNLTCAKSLSSLRGYIDENYKEVVYSTYGIRPQKMFEGVDQRITVFFAKKNDSQKKNTPVYISYNGHFQWRDREDLVDALRHRGAGCVFQGLDVVKDGWPKFHTEIESKVLAKVKPDKTGNSFYDLISKEKTDFPVYYYGNARYFIKAIDYVPFYKNLKNPKKENTELKVVYAKDALSQKAMIALINSTLFYWAWVTFSDCFHMDIKILKYFVVNSNELRKLNSLSQKMVNALKKTSFKKKHGENMITEFNVRDCHEAIKGIDDFLSHYFLFSKQESNFISSFAFDLRKSKNSVDSCESMNEEEAA